MRFLCVLFLVSCYCQSAVAETDQANLIVLQLPGLTEKDGSGAYSNFYNELLEEGAISDWKFTAPLRAHQSFLSKESNCIAPASLDLLDRYNQPVSDFASSVPFNKALGIVMRAVVPPTGVGQKPVMGTVGFGVQHGVAPGSYRIESIPDYMRLLKLIGENRLDAAYIVYPDVVHFPGAEESIAAFNGTSEVVWQGTDGVLCWKKYADVVTNISALINHWKEVGKLQKLLGKYYVE